MSDQIIDDTDFPPAKMCNSNAALSEQSRSRSSCRNESCTDQLQDASLQEDLDCSLKGIVSATTHAPVWLASLPASSY